MYIVSNRTPVKESEVVNNEEIIRTIFNISKECVTVPILCYDFFNYIDTIPEHCNGIIVDALIRYFGHIVDQHFIEVIERSSFDYEYGGIEGTHHEECSLGYVRRTPENEEMAFEGPWDEDYYYY